eukprot:CAMPEP_0181436100 /NCGR_PEP_ID=MMETSP1110-20121109/20673_1 /TAXON_ID=174948 /ORGANISM="Symbiodinium sp., Strain CCMP421" /LENGTH=420 /DNA_ID=CAMNT_0023559653 /DNA_START=475 /DNA_END=1737 /DNA_ORIENTATION=-
MTIVAIGTMTIETAAAAMHMVVILPVVVTTVVATVIVATKVVAVMVMMVFVEIRRAVMKVATRIKAEDGVLLAAEIFLGRRPECSPLLHVLVASVRLLSMVFVQHKAGGMLMVNLDHSKLEKEHGELELDEAQESRGRESRDEERGKLEPELDEAQESRGRECEDEGEGHEQARDKAQEHIVVNHMVDHMMRFVCMASITANAKLVAAERLLVAGPAQSPVPLACLAVERHLDVDASLTPWSQQKARWATDQLPGCPTWQLNCELLPEPPEQPFPWWSQQYFFLASFHSVCELSKPSRQSKSWNSMLQGPEARNAQLEPGRGTMKLASAIREDPQRAPAKGGSTPPANSPCSDVQQEYLLYVVAFALAHMCQLIPVTSSARLNLFRNLLCLLLIDENIGAIRHVWLVFACQEAKRGSVVA